MKKKGKQMDALLHHLLRSSAARFPGKEAIVQRNRRMTCAGTWRAVRSLASRLKSAGLERGDRLGVFLDASIPQALSIFAASAADVEPAFRGEGDAFERQILGAISRR